MYGIEVEPFGGLLELGLIMRTISVIDKKYIHE